MHQIHVRLALLAAFTGCVESSHEADEVGAATQAVVENNGVSLNGVSLNGVSLNGVSLNGVSLNGVSLNGVSLNGVSLNGVSLNGVSLNGVSLNGHSLSGTDLQGVVSSTWSGVLSNGSALPFRLDSAEQGTGSNRDVGMYGISYETEEGWQPLCGLDANGAPTLALVVPGTWNQQVGVAGGGAYHKTPDLVTFACRGKTIAKCVELGYKPWNGNAVQLATCVRLLRADVCGDGRSYTQDGSLVNLYDNVGIQADTEAWVREAEWTPNGLRCMASRSGRFFKATDRPSCLTEAHYSRSCGSFATGTILVSEVPPPV